MSIYLPVVKVLPLTKEFMNLKTYNKGDVGFDLRSSEDVVLEADSFKRILCTARIQMEEGYFAVIMGRSGLSQKGVQCHIGLIDSTYTGHLSPTLYNHSDSPYLIKKGDRIAQLVFFTQTPVEFKEVEGFEDVGRGEKGFGSTGEK